MALFLSVFDAPYMSMATYMFIITIMLAMFGYIVNLTNRMSSIATLTEQNNRLINLILAKKDGV